MTNFQIQYTIKHVFLEVIIRYISFSFPIDDLVMMFTAGLHCFVLINPVHIAPNIRFVAENDISGLT